MACWKAQPGQSRSSTPPLNVRGWPREAGTASCLSLPLDKRLCDRLWPQGRGRTLPKGSGPEDPVAREGSCTWLQKSSLQRGWWEL